MLYFQDEIGFVAKHDENGTSKVLDLANSVLDSTSEFVKHILKGSMVLFPKSHDSY